MDTQKKSKIIRIVTFVALTIIVILAIVLTMYFVQKNDEKNNIDYINGEIGKTIENGSYYFKVYDLKSEEASEENVRLTIYIEIQAKEDVELNIDDFKLDNYALESQSGFNNSIKSGEKLDFQLNYVVKCDNKLLYLIYNNIKIALGEAHA